MQVETKNALKKLKNGKAAVCDNIPPEAIRDGGETLEGSFEPLQPDME